MKFTRAAEKRTTNSFAHPENGGIPVESGSYPINPTSHNVILMFDSQSEIER
jgi:hypothetical protein